MKVRKIPLRKCNGCCEMKPKKELIRIVKAPDIKDEDGNVISQGEISLDITGKKSGRGAYICHNMDCFNSAVKAKRIEKSFGCKIPNEVYEIMRKQLENEGAEGFE